MADFVQTMKDWRRMCKHYSDESVKAEQLSCEDMCPLGHNTACGIMEDALDSDIEVMAKEIAKWAAEHPEPVYPTWAEWLIKIGGAVKKLYAQQYHYEAAQPTQLIEVVEVLDEPIPTDIAQKLGLKPKQ